MVGIVGKHLKDVNCNYQLPSLRFFITINSYYVIVKSYLFTDLPPLLDSLLIPQGEGQGFIPL